MLLKHCCCWCTDALMLMMPWCCWCTVAANVLTLLNQDRDFLADLSIAICSSYFMCLLSVCTESVWQLTGRVDWGLWRGWQRQSDSWEQVNTGRSSWATRPGTYTNQVPRLTCSGDSQQLLWWERWQSPNMTTFVAIMIIMKFILCCWLTLFH